MTGPIEITATSPRHAILTVDLAGLTDEPQTNRRNRLRVTRDISQYREADLALRNRVMGVAGGLLWEDMLNNATVGLTSEEKQMIRLSPASTFLKNSMVELVKNAIDEAILANKTSCQMSMVIDTSHPNIISIQLTDTGRGFSKDFLKQTQTEEGKQTYIDNSGSDKLKQAATEYIELLGGKGRGLRMLMASIEGDTLVESGIRAHTYIKPEVSTVSFANTPGASITITTSKQMLQKIPTEQVVYINEPALILPNKRSLKKTVEENTKNITTVYRNAVASGREPSPTSISEPSIKSPK